MQGFFEEVERASYKKVFVCADNFDAMMSCIYDAWVWVAGENNKAQTKHNAVEDIRLMIEPVYQQDMFSEYTYVDADSEKANKVVNTIMRNISKDAYMSVYYAAMSADSEKLNDIYKFIRLGLMYGPKITYMLTEPVVMRMQELRKKIGNEMHHFREFVRFNKLEYRTSIDENTHETSVVYISHIEPKSNVAYMVAGHFADRMPSEN